MTRLLATSLTLSLLFSAFMAYVVFSQRRDFPRQGRIVFEMGHHNYRVYSIQPNSGFGEQIRLVFNPEDSFADRFVTGVDCSPNSQSLIFWYIYLYRFDLADFSLRRLVLGDGLSQQSVWSPDGEQIAYLDNLANGAIRDIFTVQADGSNKTQVTNTPAQETSLSWSPDNRRIAYTYRRSVSSPEHGLAVIDLDTGTVTSLYESVASLRDASWSPDGTRIAFSMAEGVGSAVSRIYTIAPDGSKLMRLNGAAQNNIMPRWSPDGSMISFSARNSGESYSLYVMNTDGSAAYQVFLALPGEDVFNRCWLSEPA